MDAMTERRSAGAKLMDDMEALEIKCDTQAETIRAYEATINQMADKIDLLNRQLAATQASEFEFMSYANELGIQLRNNVAANVRALEIANNVAQRMKQRQAQDAQTAQQSADVETLLSGVITPDTTTDIPHFLNPAPLYVDDGAPRIHIVGEVDPVALDAMVQATKRQVESVGTRMLREMRVT